MKTLPRFITSRLLDALKISPVVFFEPWFRNIGKRLVRSPKGFLPDSLMLCHMLDLDIDDLQVKRLELFGHVLDRPPTVGDGVELLPSHTHRPTQRDQPGRR